MGERVLLVVARAEASLRKLVRSSRADLDQTASGQWPAHTLIPAIRIRRARSQAIHQPANRGRAADQVADAQRAYELSLLDVMQPA